MVTSVGPRRPETVRTALGAYQFNHVTGRLLYGYDQIELAPGQPAFVAGPEKALLDLVYLTPRGDSSDYLESLRLQHLDAMHAPTLLELAARAGKPRLIRAARRVAGWIEADA